MAKKFKNIAKLVTSIRTDAKMSQVEFSKMLGYRNGQFISNVERGLCALPAKTIPIICSKLDFEKSTLVNAMIDDYRYNLNKAVGYY